MRNNGRTKVLVAVDPITLRSALSVVLASDPRLEVVELAADAAFEHAAAEADIALVTRATDCSVVPVALIDHLTATVEVNGTAAKRVFDYQGLPWLTDLLVAWPHLPVESGPNPDTYFFVAPDGGTPESATGGDAR